MRRPPLKVNRQGEPCRLSFWGLGKGLVFVVELTKGGFCRGERFGGEIVKADRGMIAILADRGVGEVDVTRAITTVATVNKADFRRAPGLRADASYDEGTLGGDGIGLSRHNDKLPERRKEHTDADGHEGQKEGAHPDFKPNRDFADGCFCAIDGNGVIGVAKDNGTQESATDNTCNRTPRNTEDHGADGAFGEGAGDGFARPEELFVEVELVLETLRFIGSKHRGIFSFLHLGRGISEDAVCEARLLPHPNRSPRGFQSR